MNGKYFPIMVFILFPILFLSGCKMDDEAIYILKVSPEMILSKTGSTIIVEGMNFNEKSSVLADDKSVPTVFINSKKLKATIDKNITGIPLNISKKNIFISVKNGDTTSNKFSVSISHTPVCNSSSIVLDGEGVYKREIGNLLYFKNGNIIIIYKEMADKTSEYEQKFILSKDKGLKWESPKSVSGELLNINEKLYRIDDLKIFKSDDYGDSWKQIGEYPEFIPSQKEDLTVSYLKWAGGSNFYCIFSTSTPSNILNIYTNSSTDFGDSWKSKEKFSYDVSNLYEGEGLQPIDMVVNNKGGIRLEFLTRYGRNMVGVAFVSSDGGSNYTQTFGAYSNRGEAYLSEDFSILGVYQEYYTGAVIGEGFFYRTNLGMDYQYGTDLWKLFKKRDKSMPHLNIKMPDRIFVSLRDLMSASFDKGKNWTKPASFYTPVSKDSEIRPFVIENGSCFVVEINPKAAIRFSRFLIE